MEGSGSEHVDAAAVTPAQDPARGGALCSEVCEQEAVAGGPLSRRQLRRLRRRRRWRRWLLSSVVALVVVAVLGVVSAVRLSVPAATAEVRPHAVDRSVPVPGKAPSLPWPATGQAAVAIPMLGVEQQSGPELPVPIASMAKIMTGYIVLRDHPLSPAQGGPTITMTAVDVADYSNEVGSDESSVPVVVGEQLSEQQLLQGMLVRSAGNFADALARWDSGSVVAFVAKMNFVAAALGMHETHYADTSGFDPATTSTARDQLVIGARAMALPAFARIVDMPSVTLPVGGTFQSYTPLVGTGNVVGVKSGFTPQAGGCDMLATLQELGGTNANGQLVGQRSVLVLAVVTGQQMADVLPTTGSEALRMVVAAAAPVRTVRAVDAGDQVAAVLVDGRPTPAAAAGSASVLAWPGQTVSVELGGVRRVQAGAREGSLVAHEIVRAGSQREVVPVRLTRRLPSKSLVQRLL